MNWKYCLVHKHNQNGDPICGIHFMFFDEDSEQELISENPVTLEATSRDKLVKHLFDMIRTLESDSLQEVDLDELEICDE